MAAAREPQRVVRCPTYHSADPPLPSTDIINRRGAVLAMATMEGGIRIHFGSQDICSNPRTEQASRNRSRKTGMRQTPDVCGAGSTEGAGILGPKTRTWILF